MYHTRFNIFLDLIFIYITKWPDLFDVNWTKKNYVFFCRNNDNKMRRKSNCLLLRIMVSRVGWFVFDVYVVYIFFIYISRKSSIVCCYSTAYDFALNGWRHTYFPSSMWRFDWNFWQSGETFNSTWRRIQTKKP